jgi:flagellar hook assembly protein FlgD
MEGPERPGKRSVNRGPVLLAALLLLTVAAFGATRAMRSRDDIVNSVELTRSIAVGERALVSFRLTEPDSRADVLIIDRRGDQVRALDLGEPLEAGPHSYRWNGTGDDGGRVEPGRYRLRVILGEQDRDIEPPGSVRVRGGGG